ncbi:protein of unknown function [Modestobacter italicus]|uniref:Uncharacterized protein n=1 Tax=Modestobacter italicus (strain DSM 44449 / CECT 9708 / BC 501) TaxID=2732864 RepID=I4EWZ8_MODI5|nr:protein of unknown function [Modestobacter marinus]
MLSVGATTEMGFDALALHRDGGGPSCRHEWWTTVITSGAGRSRAAHRGS